jgi:hypothetical protein
MKAGPTADIRGIPTAIRQIPTKKKTLQSVFLSPFFLSLPSSPRMNILNQLYLLISRIKNVLCSSYREKEQNQISKLS